jgi:y4mF family transcriptional regulator
MWSYGIIAAYVGERRHPVSCGRSTTPEAGEHLVMRARTAADIGIVIRQRRGDLAMTQQQLADLARVSRTWLVAVESGHRRAELGKVLSVLDVLDLTIDVAGRQRGRVDLDAILARRPPLRDHDG